MVENKTVIINWASTTLVLVFHIMTAFRKLFVLMTGAERIADEEALKVIVLAPELAVAVKSL